MSFGWSAGLIASTSVTISMLIILCIGFTWTFMMEKFPNFAHTGYASLGTMTTFYLVRLQGVNPYLSMPISALIGGLFGVILYLGVVRFIKIEGFREITLTFTFYILSQMIFSVLAIFSYWLLIYKRIISGGFMLRQLDFRWNGYPGIAIVAPIIMIFLVVTLHLFLYITKFGISMRATAENEDLAASLGVNTKFVHIFSWFISGALAALAGAIMPLWAMTVINPNDKLLVSVMAGSVLGGLTSIHGAIIGGLFVATSQTLLSYLLIHTFGVHMGAYEALLPIIILLLVLAIEPNGITGFRGKEISLHHIKTSLMNFFKTMRNMFNLEW